MDYKITDGQMKAFCQTPHGRALEASYHQAIYDVQEFIKKRGPAHPLVDIYYEEASNKLHDIFRDCHAWLGYK